MNDISEIVIEQRKYFALGETKNVKFRIAQLKKMQTWIRDHETEILKGLKKDLNKAPFEAYATEVGIVLEEIKYTLKRIKKWSKPKSVKTPITQFPSKSRIYPEPYGVALIMSPWNYPFQLTLAPLVGAISAGNCAIVKPSAYAPATSAVIKKMADEIFDKKLIAVIEGGRKENQSLLEEKFDYIFFTGGVKVGKSVMESASKHLTPVSLELGGKSPCIVDGTADLKLAAKRIVWGKFLNAGQTCVAPDYLLIQKSAKKQLIDFMKEYITSFYGVDASKNDDFPKIVNQKHYDRLKGLLGDGEIVFGGQFCDERMQMAPTLIDNVDFSSNIMQAEIFGPIMPILEFDNIDEVIEKVNGRPKPLALYYFTKNKENESKLLKFVSFGGGCINDTIVHLATSNMPFGGVGDSGMGAYHGVDSFLTFSHSKSIMKKSLMIDIPLRYPPYKNHIKLLKKIQK